MSGHRWGSSTRRETLPPNWRSQIRPRVLRRDGGRCQLVYPDRCVGTATEVDHIGDRLDHSLDNLRAVCEPCHAKRTQEQISRYSEKRPTEPHPGIIR